VRYVAIGTRIVR